MAVADPHAALLEALRRRAADPERRLDQRMSAFEHEVRSLDFGAIMSLGRQLTGDLMRLVQAIQSTGTADPESVRQAERFGGLMERPDDRDLPAPCAPDVVDAAEAELGFPLPPLLRRLYTEVANGGIGPGYGIIGLAGGWTDEQGDTLVEQYRSFSGNTLEALGHRWPDRLLPLCHYGDGAFACVSAADADGAVVVFDLSDTEDEEPTAEEWAAAFTEQSPSLAAWLEAWLEGPPVGGLTDAEMSAMWADASEPWATPEEYERIAADWFRSQGLEPPDIR